MKFKLAFIVLTGLFLYAFSYVYDQSFAPKISKDMAVAQLNGGESELIQLRILEDLKHKSKDILVAVWVVISAAILLTCLPSSKAKSTAAMLLLSLGFSGCRRPYDVPQYEEIGTNETAFVVPLEGDVGQQAKFESEEHLKQLKVASKRILITKRWSPKGYETVGYDGEWIPTIRLIKVDRSPVTRQWSTTDADAKVGSRTASGAIWVESADSIGFSMGFNCTAFIAEPDTAKFLYWYPSGSLSNVMDSEIKARMQQDAAEVAAKLPLDKLRGEKQSIIDHIKADVVPFFAERGITITTIGMFGGMTYEAPKIQDSIDQVFVAQQEKSRALAEWEAQQKKNEKIELEAMALAEAARTKAKGEADGIKSVTEAIKEANQNPAFLEFKRIEVQKAQVEKWDGRFPQWMMGNSSPNMLFQTPTPPTLVK